MAVAVKDRVDQGLMAAGRLRVKYLDVLLPIAFFALVIVLFVPLPPVLMDVLLVLNISFSAIVIMTVIYVNGPLQFSVFPSLLLGATVFRLILNIATTRLILANAGDRGLEAAGTVIRTFAEFVAGGSVAIGFIIFIIIIIVQFVVITKGATRVAEVAARFALDAMPGKQMAIDADLNAGIIDQETARQRRDEISRDADFYGAMDGASKFVRGDAIAGILITIVNIIGGLIVGMTAYGMSWGEAIEVFTKLTIGDGLVSQIPALIVSTAAGLLVTRTSSRTHLGTEFFGQMFSIPRAFMFTGAFLLVLLLTPLPKIPLIMISLSCIGIGLVMNRSRQLAAEAEEKEVAKEQTAKPEKIENLLGVDPMELEVGYGLIRMVDTSQGGDLLERVTLIRRQMATTLGFILPSIRIRDNMQLSPNQYVVKIRGVKVAQGEANIDQFLAMDSGMASEKLDAVLTREPAFNLKAYWIPEDMKPRAEALGYTVVEATTVVVTHLTEIIKKHASDLITREEVKRLLDNLRETAPSLVDEVVPKVLSHGELQKVLQRLLAEQVSIRDLEVILEVLGDYGTRTKDVEILTEYARNALAANICEAVRETDRKIYVVTLDPGIEETIAGSVQHTERGSFLSMSPVTAETVTGAVASAIEELVAAGHQPVVLTSPQIRFHVRKMLEKAIPGTAVLSYNEIARETDVQSVAVARINR